MSIAKTRITSSAQETRALGRQIAQEILQKPLQQQARIIALDGELGSGKTTFLQGFAQGLGIKEKVTSPTFVILKRFKITNQNIKISKYRNFFHIDCYRIEKPQEILDLGFKEILAEPKNIIAIEWPKRIKKILPKQTLWLKFKLKAVQQREIVIG